MLSEKLSWGIGICVLVAAITTSCVMFTTENEPAKAMLISADNLIEIKEDQQLDEYGFDRLHAEVTEGRVQRNESLYLILRDLDVSPQKIYEINKESSGVFQSSRIRPGQRYLAYADKNTGRTHRLVFHKDALDYVVIDWKDGVEINTGRKQVTTKVTQASGIIQSSLYETLVAQDQNWLLANNLSEIFAWQVDFFRLYPGDSYKVIYEEQYIDGKPYGIGRILAAEFKNKGETFDAFYFESEAFTGYYDADGNGVQKALLKAPFKYSQRISSGFSSSRFHPVLKRRVPHYGVDYAAPLGTPVLSVGDGEVTEAQYRGANGNIVKIRHNGTYTTAYLHLNGFAKGIRPGKRVQQGQVIGYVGKTGRVTGVHLDYRIYKNGSPVNPLKIDLPPSKAIGNEEKANFERQIEELKIQLENMDESQDNTITSVQS